MSTTITFSDDKLAKAIIHTAKTLPEAEINALSETQKKRAICWLHAMNASPEKRAEIRDKALASGKPAAMMLGDLLTMFETLSPDDKVNYIMAFKRRAKLVAAGLPVLAKGHRLDFKKKNKDA
jgi:hypothetical protein